MQHYAIDKILSISITHRSLVGFSRFIALPVRDAPSRHDSRVNERLMKPRAIFHQGFEVRAPGITYPRRWRECYVTRRYYTAKRVMLPARFTQVARTRALCVPRCLKSFPISAVHTIALEHYIAPLAGIHRAIADEYVYQTSLRVV